MKFGIWNVRSMYKIDHREIRTVWYGLDRSGSGLGQVEGSCKHGNEPSGSIKCWGVAARLADSQEGLNSLSK
jgi:hypothetical protein